MPQRLTRQIYRERRRMALIAVLAFGAVRLAGPPALGHTLTAAAVALGLGAAIGFVSIRVPSLRRACDAGVLAGCVFADLSWAIPEASVLSGARPEAVLAFLALWFGLVGFALSLRRSLGALPPRRARTRLFRARAGSQVDIFRLWHGLVPMSPTAGTSDPANLWAVQDMSLRLGRMRLTAQLPPAPEQPGTPQILELEAPFHIRLRTGAGDAHGIVGAAGVSEIFLVELGPQRLVLFSHAFPDMPLWHAIITWLHDVPGRMLDRRIDLIECCARMEDAHGLARADASCSQQVPRPDTEPDAAPLAQCAPRPAIAATVADWDADLARDSRDTPADPGDRRRAS